MQNIYLLTIGENSHKFAIMTLRGKENCKIIKACDIFIDEAIQNFYTNQQYKFNISN